MSTAPLPPREKPAPGGSGAVSGRRILLRAAVLLGVVICGLLVYRLTALREWLEPAGAVAAWVRARGWPGALLFYAGTALLIFLGVPRLVFCPLAGALYGFWGGLALSLAAPATSYFLTFLALRGRAEGPLPDLPPGLRFLARDPGMSGVILARLLPLPGMLITLALSLSGVGRRKYLFGTLIGLIPEAAPLVLLGAGWVDRNLGHPVHFGALALVLFGVGWLAWRRVRHKQRARAAAAEPSPTPAQSAPPPRVS
jgi:uncharacterized membrane protein YdjX (TVP38/TMEM64 family)